jgi:hypothetical protein
MKTGFVFVSLLAILLLHQDFSCMLLQCVAVQYFSARFIDPKNILFLTKKNCTFFGKGGSHILNFFFIRNVHYAKYLMSFGSNLFCKKCKSFFNMFCKNLPSHCVINHFLTENVGIKKVMPLLKFNWINQFPC